MTYNELLNLLNDKSDSDDVHALRAVVELHKPEEYGGPARCPVDGSHYPCSTIQVLAEHFTPIVIDEAETK